MWEPRGGSAKRGKVAESEKSAKKEGALPLIADTVVGQNEIWGLA